MAGRLLTRESARRALAPYLSVLNRNESMAPLVIDVSSSDDPRDIVHRAVQALVEGQIVVFPTETVYVATAAALSSESVVRLAKLRGEDPAVPLSLAIRSTDDVLDYVPRLPPLGSRLARRCWPGPLTLEADDTHSESVLRRLSDPVQRIVCPQGRVRLRVPAHKLINGVLRLLPGPLVMAGAHRPGDDDSVEAAQVVARLGSDVDVILDDGRCKFAQHSSVVYVCDKGMSVARPGVISEANLKRLASFMVVTVCTGNTCRSPMAEAMLKKRMSEKLGCPIEQLEDHGFLVMSAGISAAPGSRSAEEAQTIMKERGLDLSLHESQPLSERLVRFADRIITMTRGHREAILSQYPEAASRTFILARNRGDVADPIGGPVEYYRRCAEQIDGYLESWADELAALHGGCESQ